LLLISKPSGRRGCLEDIQNPMNKKHAILFKEKMMLFQKEEREIRQDWAVENEGLYH
jgi:hypothetical protein